MQPDADLRRIVEAAARDAGGLDAALLDGFPPAVLEAAATGRRLRRRELAACADAGRRAATGAVALRAVVDLYLSAAWRLWRDAPAVAGGDADDVRAAALAVLRAADDGVAALAEGYQLARADLARLQEAARHDVVEALLAGGRQALEAAGPAADLGLAVAGPVGVLVARRPGAFGDAATAGVPARLERALRGRHADAQPLVLTRGGMLLCLFAAPDAAAVAEVRERAAAELTAHLGPPDAHDRGWRAALSTPRTGPAAVRVSHDEALDALDLADRLGLTAGVVDAAELVVYRVLLRDRAAAVDLVVAVLTPLTGARGGAVPLLQTLEAYYATGCVATATAARLHLSVRAVTYRLARIADLLGRDPADPAERFAVQAAVTAARLLDWPRTPLDTA